MAWSIITNLVEIMFLLGVLIAWSIITWYCIQYEVVQLEHKSDFELTPDTPYLASTGELWGVWYEYIGEN